MIIQRSEMNISFSTQVADMGCREFSSRGVTRETRTRATPINRPATVTTHSTTRPLLGMRIPTFPMSEPIPNPDPTPGRANGMGVLRRKDGGFFQELSCEAEAGCLNM